MSDVELPVNRPGRMARMRTRLARFGNWLSSVKPGPRAWTGAAIGAFVAGTAAAAAQLGHPRLGFGAAYDVTLSILTHGAGVAVCTAILILIAWLVRFVPLRVVGAVGGAMAAMVGFQILWSGFAPPFLIVGGIIPLETLFGFALGAVVGGELIGATRLKKSLVLSLLGITSIANIALAMRLASPGSDDYLTPLATTSPVTAIEAADPGAHGPFRVKSLVYGSGNEPGRTDFADAAQLKTQPVDASRLLPDWKGFRKAARERFWGFDPKRFPINGHVWMPDGAGPFPLVLVVHGNHTMEEYSDPGYEYLCDHLASHGYIAVSVDENFLNGSWSGDFRGKELPARAWILLEHLKCWRSWNKSPGNPLSAKVDLDKIALVGHSRGGEAAAVAAAFNHLSRYPEDGSLTFDFGFSIRGIVAIAPSEGFYKPAGESVQLEGLDYLVIQGAHDADVAIFLGSRQYQHVKVTGATPHFKCALSIDRANHGQFNTVWGTHDMDQPLYLLQNIKPLISGDKQRQIAAVFITAFLETSLRHNASYLPMFLDPRRAARWLPPDAAYQSRYSDSSFTAVSDFDEGVDLGTTTIPGGTQTATGMKEWREERVPLRAGDMVQDNRAVYLEWEKSEAATAAPAEFHIELPADLGDKSRPSPRSGLRFALARAEDSNDPIKIKIRLESAGGQSAEMALNPVGPPIRVRVTKLGRMESWLLKPFEVFLQTFEIPMADFARANPRLDVEHLRKISFLFDTSQSGSVYLDDIGFTRRAD